MSNTSGIISEKNVLQIGEVKQYLAQISAIQYMYAELNSKII